MQFRRCPNHPLFCVPRQLFCDGMDNCGLNSDEKDCADPLTRIAVNIVDSRTEIYGTIFSASFAIVLAFSVILIVFLYRWYMRTHAGYSSKYVKNVFGIQKEHLSNYEAEETVALLTLGLRQMIPYMPANRRLSHYHSVRYGTMF